MEDKEIEENIAYKFEFSSSDLTQKPIFKKENLDFLEFDPVSLESHDKKDNLFQEDLMGENEEQKVRDLTDDEVALMTKE